MGFLLYKQEENKISESFKLVNKNIGKPFPFEYISDTTGKNISVSFLNTSLTIIDLWFEQCPACIKEMSEFEQVLKGKENKISILSLSIDPISDWKKLFASDNPSFSFLKKNIPGWKHGIIQPSDSFAGTGSYIVNRLNTNHYPGYFVIDKKGIIKATPVSAITYIKTNIDSQFGYWLYLKEKFKEKEFLLNVLFMITFYNGVFWFIAFLIFFFQKVIVRTTIKPH